MKKGDRGASDKGTYGALMDDGIEGDYSVKKILIRFCREEHK